MCTRRKEKETLKGGLRCLLRSPAADSELICLGLVSGELMVDWAGSGV
jgi:hypothetical protein